MPKSISYNQDKDEAERAILGSSSSALAEDDPTAQVGGVDSSAKEGDPDFDNAVENSDGSVTFLDPEEKVELDMGEDTFYENLAEVLEERLLKKISSTLIEKIDLDKLSREKRDNQIAEGMARTGLGNDAPGGATFEGASKVVHPMVVEACVDFASAAIKELFPPNGPVKAKVIGKDTEEKKSRAKRKVEFLNWQLVTQVEEYYTELEQTLSQLPMGGSQYMKFRFDDTLGRITCEFVPVDEVYLPFSATNFYTSPRVTHVQQLTKMTFEDRIDSGMYRELELGDPSDIVRSQSSLANDDIEGKEEGAFNEDGLRTVFEVQAWFTIEEDELAPRDYAPYIITIDEHTEKVLSVYRNWDPADKRCKKLDWMVEWGFIPWRGAYKLGFPQLIGGLSTAATGALRALLDSAHINNAACAVKLKGGRTNGQDQQVEITEIQELDAPAGVDDIRKLIMPMPFNPPSTVLFQLLGWLSDAAKGVITTAEEKIADANSNMPVGTTLALIEQGSKVAAAIHARLHRSQMKALDIICRLNRDFLDVEEVNDAFGEEIVTPDDFKNNTDIQPVSDPNVFSEAQRFAKWQALLQMSQDGRIKWNVENLYRDGLEMMKVPDPDRYMPEEVQPLSADPVNENQQAVMKGTPLKATADQDHIAHISEHLRFVADPMQGGCPLVPGQAVQGIMQHCVEHLMYAYTDSAAKDGAQVAAQLILSTGQHPNADQLSARVGKAAAERLGKAYGQQFNQLLQAAQKSLQDRMPKPAADPVQLTYQAAMAETQRQTQKDQSDAQIKQAELSNKAQTSAREIQHKLLAMSQDMQLSNKKQMQDYQIALGELQQGYIKLEQDAKKLGIEDRTALHSMLMDIQGNIQGIEGQIGVFNNQQGVDDGSDQPAQADGYGQGYPQGGQPGSE